MSALVSYIRAVYPAAVELAAASRTLRHAVTEEERMAARVVINLHATPLRAALAAAPPTLDVMLGAAVDCTGVSISFCASLHREPCALVPNTCPARSEASPRRASLPAPRPRAGAFW